MLNRENFAFIWCKTFGQMKSIFIILLSLSLSLPVFASVKPLTDIPVGNVVKTKRSKLGLQYKTKIGDSVMKVRFADAKLADQMSHIRFESKRNFNEYYFNGHFERQNGEIVWVTTEIRIKDPSIEHEIN